MKHGTINHISSPSKERYIICSVGEKNRGKWHPFNGSTGDRFLFLKATGRKIDLCIATKRSSAAENNFAPWYFHVNDFLTGFHEMF